MKCWQEIGIIAAEAMQLMALLLLTGAQEIEGSNLYISKVPSGSIVIGSMPIPTVGERYMCSCGYFSYPTDFESWQDERFGSKAPNSL